MQLRNFSKDIKMVPIETPLTGSANTTSAVIDTAGYKSFCVVVHTGLINAGSVFSVKLSHSDVADDVNTLNSGSDVAGSSQTVAADDDGQLFVLDVAEATKRYYQLTQTKSTATSLSGAVAYLYNPSGSAGGLPVTHATGSGTAGGRGSVNVELDAVATSGTA